MISVLSRRYHTLDRVFTLIFPDMTWVLLNEELNTFFFKKTAAED